MNFNHQRHWRRLLRLEGYDYSQPGAYFITICTHHRECMFGRIEGDQVELTQEGGIVAACWYDLPNHYPHVELDAFVIMPNHVHAIISLIANTNVVAGLKPAVQDATLNAPKRHPLSEIIRGFKTFLSRRINTLRKSPGTPVWQRAYYEHVIRNKFSLNLVRQYILHNPSQWEMDSDNPIVVDRFMKA